MVGTWYITLLLFVVLGGIFYIRVTVLDTATEQVARLILVNGNTSTSTAPPISAAAFAQAIQNDGYGVLQAANITVTLEACAPLGTTITMSATPTGCTGGFGAMSAGNFNHSSYQYYPGTCKVNYTATPTTSSSTSGSTTTSSISYVLSNVTTTSCTSQCSTFSNTSLINGSLLPSPTTAASTTSFTGATYTCGAGQDVMLQVTYTDPTITPLIGHYLGTVTSKLAFQIEPAVL